MHVMNNNLCNLNLKMAFEIYLILDVDDKLHGTPNTTNCGSFYTASFSLFFNTFEVYSLMNNFTLDTFVFDIFECCKIII
jgi:hypothetical protein